MKERDFTSHFPGKGIKNSYLVLEEVSMFLGLTGEELRLLFKLLRKTDCSSLTFRPGDLEISLDRNPDNTAQPEIVMTLAYENGRTNRVFHYQYCLSHLEALLQRKKRSSTCKERMQ